MADTVMNFNSTTEKATIEKDIVSNGIRIHTREQGSGEPTLVFLHYWGGSSRTWTDVMNELSTVFRTIALDQRGWGESEAPLDGYRISDLTADARGVVEALGLRHYVLVGHSMGGKVAQLLASQRPVGLKGLVLVAPSPPSPMEISAEARATMAHAYDSRESVEFVLDNVLTGRALSAEQREHVIADSLRGAPQAKAAWPNIAMLEDITKEIARIDIPVVVISGELDKVDRVETLRRELLPRIPQARMHVLAGTGHLSPYETPQKIVENIREFLRKTAESER